MFTRFKNKTKGWRKIPAIDFYTLIHLVLVASKDPQIGWNHADSPLNNWLSVLRDEEVWINRSNLEDALYCANMLLEQDKYYHPYNINLITLLDRVLKKNEKFDLDLNRIYDGTGKKK